LAELREVGVLHGDLHHGNVLDFGARQSGSTDERASDPWRIGSILQMKFSLR
jgi:streptomycin 6-kinase